MNNKELVYVNVDGDNYEVNSDMVEVRTTAKVGFNVASSNNNFIILNTELSESLILEGIAREIVSKVQNLRKELDFNITDRITLYYTKFSFYYNALLYYLYIFETIHSSSIDNICKSL